MGFIYIEAEQLDGKPTVTKKYFPFSERNERKNLPIFKQRFANPN
ncbi:MULTISPECIES: hypothetical protein [Flavobacteriaceae]|jgi:hypothetical protein|uniref:Uncharacterized protein n=1 Tax=Flagellimonas sp. MMG031 TaxID=3158549 RepID=A0AAU7MYC5_9FLAO|nr:MULTISPECIES: hypothetical protein [unclassified Allomuricauda]